MNKAYRGAYHELVACAWLVEQGYDVFQNVAPTGCVDIIAMERDTGICLKIDVKTVAEYKNADGSITTYTKKLTENQVKLGVRLLLMSDGKVLGFRN